MRKLQLDEIVSAGLCSGCGACVFAAEEGKVRMQIDIKGYLRPVTSHALSANEQETVRSVCPGIGLAHPASFENGVGYHPVWGPMAGLMTGHATDAEVRHKGSSGGVLSALLIHLLETEKVDFVVHTRASESDPLQNQTVFSTTREEILSGAGSRYAPAAPVAALHDALARPGKFAFVGKPCDVAAVRKIIASRPDLTHRIPYLLSFMCAGTPSMLGTHEIIQRLDMKAKEVVAFRYRGDGWPGLARAESIDGRSATMDYNTAWGTILNKHLQPRCKMCADGTGEFADVVCADAWYGKDGYPDFAEAAGRSLLIARTQTGVELASTASSTGSIAADAFEIAALASIQPYQKRRKQEMAARRLAAVLLNRPWPRYTSLHLYACFRQLPLRRSVKAFFGTAVRIIKGTF